MKIDIKLNIIKKNSIWFTQELWVSIFPYIKASAAWAHDNEPFWRYEDFMKSIEYINKSKFKGFCQSSDDLSNKLEMACFLGQLQQETGDPSIVSPYPWGNSPSIPDKKVTDGPSGGGLAIMEGSIAEIRLGPVLESNYDMKSTCKLSPQEKKIINTLEDDISGLVSHLAGVNQPGFGLGTGTGGGAVFQEGLYAVSDDGTVWGNDILPKPSTTDRHYACLGPYCQYGGRGAIQLSYNYNYTQCSLDLFDDLRLVQYPNLITTTDREKFNGKPFYFGFPGKNPGGDNQLPKNIKDTTPPARQLSFIVCMWFWMTLRSGKKISCHDCMVKYKTHGITGCNIIVNNQSGEDPKSWAANKIKYYIRICKIFGIPETIIDNTIIFPANKDVK